jgi:hypothetical protein
MDRSARALALFLLGSLVIACSSAETSTNDDGGAAQPDDAGSAEEDAADALDGEIVGADAGEAVPPGTLSFESEDTAAVEGLIRVGTGGTLSATGSDGTVYTLVVPAFAVSSDVTAALTPLVSVAGIADVNAVHAVQLTPDGLHFQFPARLEISPPSTIPVKRELSFTAQAGGEALGTALLDPEAGEPTLFVERFAVYGVASVSDDERIALVAVEASDPWLHLQHRVGEALAVMRRNFYLGNVEAPLDVGPEFERVWSTTVTDLIASRAISCDAEAALLDTLLSDARLHYLSGAETTADLLVAILQSRTNGEGECQQAALKVCRTSRDPAYLLEFLVRMERASALLAATSAGADNVQAARLLALQTQAIESCAVSGYVASGGRPGVSVSGTIDDPSYPFALVATLNAETMAVVYTPSDKNVNVGTYEYDSALSFGVVSGSGEYTLTEDAEGGYVLEQQGRGCIDATCGNDQAEILLSLNR